jgi:hypothetical protein
MDAKEQWKKYCNGRCKTNAVELKRCGVACGLCEHIFMSSYHSRDEEVKKYKEQKNSTVRKALQQNRELKQIITKLQHELEIQRNNNVLSEQFKVQEVKELKELLKDASLFNNKVCLVKECCRFDNNCKKCSQNLINKINEVLNGR